MQHTPGPWLRDGFLVYAVDTQSANLFTANVQDPNHLISGEEQEANARLIAAAPDLLEACEEFREAILNERHQLAEGGFSSDQINAVLGLFDDTIGNAIAKAEPSSLAA